MTACFSPIATSDISQMLLAEDGRPTPRLLNELRFRIKELGYLNSGVA
jgi:hypothetical protein